MIESKKAADRGVDKEAPDDPMAVPASYDHETGVLSEPSRDDDPKTVRHQVDPVRDPALFEEEQVNAPIPRRGDPYAHQRDKEAAQEAGEAEAKKNETDDKEADRKRAEDARLANLTVAERMREGREKDAKKDDKRK